MAHNTNQPLTPTSGVLNDKSSSASELLTLAAVAKVSPGRPSTNCVWRWCRKGVKARNGERIRLQHVRVGGMIYSKQDWLDEFGDKLAAADTEYFDLAVAAGNAGTKNTSDRFSKTPSTVRNRQAQIEAAERELEKAGI